MGNRKLKGWEIEELKKWPVKSRNKYWYWVKHGCLYWGLPTGIIVSLIEYLSEGSSFTLNQGIKQSFLFTLFGVFYGMWLYTYNNNRYKKYREYLSN